MQYTNITERKQRLEKILTEISVEERRLKEVKGSLRIQKSKYGLKYFQVVDKGDTKGRYIKKKEFKLVQQLADLDYCRKVKKVVIRELKVITRFLKDSSPNAVQEVYSKLSPQRQKLIIPFELTDKMYLEKWKNKTAEPNSYEFGTTSFITDNGEQVRSKSELIVANKLKAEGIPYKYEYPLRIQEGQKVRTIYPDFTVLNLKQRKEYRLELFGMMDDQQYRQKALDRIELYAEIGYHIGDKLLVLFEESNHPLNVKYLNLIVEKYLKW